MRIPHAPEHRYHVHINWTPLIAAMAALLLALVTMWFFYQP